MKKILFISNVGNGKVGSFSKSSVLAAKELGHEFHIAINYGNTERSDIDEEEKQYGIKIHKIDFIRNPFHPKNIKAYSQLLKLMKREKYDEVHCNTPVGGLLGRICAIKTKVPQVIYMAHGFHFYKGAPLVNKIIYKTVEKILARFTDVLVTINKEDYEAAKKFKLRSGGQVRFVHGVGIETDSFVIEGFNRTLYREQLGLSNNDIAIVSAGDLIKRKNYETAIRAIAECKNSNIKYLICGTGPEEENLKKLAEKLNIAKQIVFLGYRTDMKEIMNSSDIFLFTTRQEGLPRSMMEAMATGLPYVVSNIRGNVDLFECGKGGYLCDVENIHQIAEAISKLANASNLRDEMKRINLEGIKKYDINNIKEEIKEIYKL